MHIREDVLRYAKKLKRSRSVTPDQRPMLVMLRGGKCQDCGYFFDGLNMHHFEWHHRDPSAKSFAIAQKASASLAILWPEAEKCDLLCRFCHADRHRDMPTVQKRRERVKVEDQPDLALRKPRQ